MGKKFISVNSKYYKDSNSSGEMGHVDRLFKENVNTFSEYTKHNFGSDFNLHDRYKELHKSRIDLSGKNVRKDATTFVDSVMAFSLDQWEHLEKKHGHAKLEKAMRVMMDDYMEQMKKPMA